MNKRGFLQDHKGVNSSKRLWGSVMLGISIIFSGILFFYSINKGVTDATTALALINGFLMFGSGLLGLGLAEKIKIVKK
jgi:hypothetical protein